MGQPLVLRNSGIRIYYGTGMHDWVHGCNDPCKCFWLNLPFGVAAGDLTPTYAAAWKFDDFAVGRDTVMETIRRLEDDRSHPT